MSTVGIDKAAWFSSQYYINLTDLAQARGINPDKYTAGLGQQAMAVSPPDEDIVTLAANAAQQVLQGEDAHQIDTLLFATESGTDQSKAAGLFVHHLLGLPKYCRVVELKQACYSGTAGLQMAMAMLRQNPKRNILLIASDIARYGLNTSGESSQGGGAIALLLSANPRLLAVEPQSGYVCEDAMDFWRPNYRDEALVDGKYSCELYLRLLKEAWQSYSERSERTLSDHEHFLYHIPFPRLAEKGHQKLFMSNGLARPTQSEIDQVVGPSLQYAKRIGNCYTASLYIGLLSLLEHTRDNLAGHRIGFYSYGSGATAEYFSGVVQPHYQGVLQTAYHQQQLVRREALSHQEYERFYTFTYPTDGSHLQLPKHHTGHFRLAEIRQHQRIYKACE